MVTSEVLKTHKTTARIVGALFLAGMIIGVVGHLLMQSVLTAPDPLSNVSANSMLLAVGALLMLLPCAWDAAHGVLMFPILKQRSERLAIGYLSFRIIDAVFLAVSILFVLLQIPLASEYMKVGVADAASLQALSTVSIQANLYAYNIAMAFLGVAGLTLCYTFYRAKLVPRIVAVWGLVGYATILCGSGLEVLGFGLSSMQAIPGGLWEMFIGVWLLTKGFNAAAFVASTAKATSTSNPAQPLVSQLDAAKA